MVDKTKIDLKRSRLTREMIRKSFLEAAKKRGSLEIEFKNGHKQSLNVIERLEDGGTQLTTVDYDGTICSEKLIPYDHTTLREYSRKPFPKKRMVSARVYLKKIKCVWNTVGDDLNYVGHPKPWHDEYGDMSRVVVEPWELPTEPINVFRLNHDYLLVSFADADALELTFLSRRKTIRITEVETKSDKGLHSLEEIVRYTLKEATGNVSVRAD